MSIPDPNLSDEALDEAAASWLFERDEGFDPERAQAFSAWRRSNPRHEAALVRVEEMRALLGELPGVRASLEARIERRETPSMHPSGGGGLFRIPSSWWATGIAAALVLGMVIWWTGSSEGVPDEVYATDMTASRRVALSDGSLVDLNMGSQMGVEFSRGERRVVLSEGEAHFQVAHDAERPFIVMIGDVSVRAVGTAFNVRLAAESIDVLVVEGKVEVSQKSEAYGRGGSEEPALLAAGEQTRLVRGDPTGHPKVEKVAPESIRTQLAWQERMIPFIDLPLRELVAQFNRRNATQLVLGDPELGELKIGGVMALDQIDAFVRLLEQGGDIVAERSEWDEIVLRRVR